MEEDLKQRLEAQDELLAAIYKSVEKTRKYFLMTVIVTVITFLLPLIGLMFILPSFINTYTSSLQGLGI